ncbi:hypothetical protein INR49_021905 [Caranx melampygus]|nr:hypothetical protein INR49_021905 [Caranx melampygus]
MGGGALRALKPKCFRFVLALAPFLSHKLRLIEFELSFLAHPGDAVPCILVCEQLKQELPQLDLTVVTWRSTRTFTEFQVTPEYLSVGHFLEELLLAESAKLSTWDVDAAYLHLVNVELLHHPHSPVDHLVSRPQNRI